MVPNIFKYATKELSQDAVICWLVACAKDATGELRESGLDFVRALMQSGNGAVFNCASDQFEQHVSACEVLRVLGDPRPQYRSIDVYFRAKIDGKVVSFVIEDKTHSEMHGNQLGRYRRVVEDDGINEDLIKPVYLKTGYVFHDERERAESAGYSVFDGDEVLDFLVGGNRAGTHEILRQYAEYMKEQHASRQCALKEWKLQHGFVQWEFMVRLGESLQMKGMKWPARWFNVGGSAWTQYPHYKDRGALYWRLDSWKPLRLMVATNKAGDQVLARWNGWSRAFEDAREEAGLSAGSFRRVRRRRGEVVKEGTIGAVDVASCLRDEGLDHCVARVRHLHRAFMRSVGDELS